MILFAMFYTSDYPLAPPEGGGNNKTRSQQHCNRKDAKKTQGGKLKD